MLVSTSKDISSFSCNDCIEEIIARDEDQYADYILEYPVRRNSFEIFL